MSERPSRFLCPVRWPTHQPSVAAGAVLSEKWNKHRKVVITVVCVCISPPPRETECLFTRSLAGHNSARVSSALFFTALFVSLLICKKALSFFFFFFFFFFFGFSSIFWLFSGLG